MFVGEAPGQTEDEQGRPFVGRAGKLLDEMIASIGLKRRSVYIANICKCRPPNNRKPAPAEMKACISYLHAQITVIRPKVIVALGATAVEGLLGPGVGVTQRHGHWEVYEIVTEKGSDNIYAMPAFHPSYLLRSPDKKEEALKDFFRVKEMICGSKPKP
jgi:DNA polymerase